jgi:hypothetical protein
MPGERFSALQLEPGDPAQDSDRTRNRVGALFRETAFNLQTERLAIYLSRELGVPIPSDGKYSAHWQAFIRECQTRDFLDTITVVHRYLFWHVDEGTANWWRDVVRQIFAEEHLAYEIDDAGGVHPAVDRAFQGNRAFAVTALQSHRYQNVRDLFEGASTNLTAARPNYKRAWQATFSALEGLFGLMFPHVRLSVNELERCLRPVVERAYEGDATAQKTAHRMLAGFREWVEASHNYRHQPGAEEPAQPPADIAILAISHGTSLLRWLATLDENRVT